MDFLKVSDSYYEEMLRFIRGIATIPAPSGDEGRRAEYVLRYWKEIGAEGAYIDEAKNVIVTLGEENGEGAAVFMAHTDIVFPEETPLGIREDDKTIAFPGATDDVACLAVLFGVLKYLLDNHITPKRRLIFVANACEEGLGNLRGCRQLFSDYEGEISVMYTLDGLYSALVNDAVGSHRYEITAITEGGHSFGAFGNRNAIHVLAEIIRDIYSIEVPHVGGSKTTYNVGTIFGGTSVNTIAQNATMLAEYRSDNAACLAEMKRRFEEIFERARASCTELRVSLVGDRPCKEGVDEALLAALTEEARSIQETYTGGAVQVRSGSTDANIPLSIGIPALCIGVCHGGGAHTREEWLEKESIKKGFAIAAELIVKKGEISL